MAKGEKDAVVHEAKGFAATSCSAFSSAAEHWMNASSLAAKSFSVA